MKEHFAALVGNFPVVLVDSGREISSAALRGLLPVALQSHGAHRTVHLKAKGHRGAASQ